jgi:hypothetical protein
VTRKPLTRSGVPAPVTVKTSGASPAHAPICSNVVRLCCQSATCGKRFDPSTGRRFSIVRLS